MRALVVDDHLLLGQALGGLLTQLFPLELHGVCASVADALELLANASPDLVLLDVCLPGERWQDLAEPYLAGNSQGALLFVTGLDQGFEPPAELGQHVLGVIQKSASWSALIGIVGQWLLRRGALAGLPLSSQRQPLDWLSPRELRVFEALGQGMLNREVAEHLGLSTATVDSYRKSICSKLGVSGAELVRQAVICRCLPGVLQRKSASSGEFQHPRVSR